MRTSEDRYKDYRLYKRLHLCVQCHEMDAFTIGGRAYCADCTEKNKTYRQRWYEKHKADDNERRRKQRDQWRALGLCTHCGKPLPEGHRYRTCDRCRLNARLSKRKETEARTGWPTGMRWERPDCPRCGRPSKEGHNAAGVPYRLCDRCWETSMRGLQASMEAGKGEHWWNRDNKIAFPRRSASGNSARSSPLNG